MDANNLKVGDIVPDFKIETFDTATNEFGQIHLESNTKARKWLVLFFYPADFTFVCPTELNDLANKYKELVDAHLGWFQSEQLLKNVKFPMGSDPTGKISRMFGVYDELLRKVKANVYLASHPDEACPAKWEDGQKTLKPSAKLVGKVYEALK